MITRGQLKRKNIPLSKYIPDFESSDEDEDETISNQSSNDEEYDLSEEEEEYESSDDEETPQNPSKKQRLNSNSSTINLLDDNPTSLSSPIDLLTPSSIMIHHRPTPPPPNNINEPILLSETSPYTVIDISDSSICTSSLGNDNNLPSPPPFLQLVKESLFEPLNDKNSDHHHQMESLEKLSSPQPPQSGNSSRSNSSSNHQEEEEDDEESSPPPILESNQPELEEIDEEDCISVNFDESSVGRSRVSIALSELQKILELDPSNTIEDSNNGFLIERVISQSEEMDRSFLVKYFKLDPNSKLKLLNLLESLQLTAQPENK